MTTYRITNSSGNEVTSGGEFTLEGEARTTVDEMMFSLQGSVPIRFGDNSVRVDGTRMSVDRWAAPSGRLAGSRQTISYRSTGETATYSFLESQLGVDLRPYLGSAAGFIREMRLDLQVGALPLLRATFVVGLSDPIGPVMTQLLDLPAGPLRLTNHTLSMAMDSVATLEADFVIDNRTRFDLNNFVAKPETTYAPEPAPDKLPAPRKPETRFREWAASLKGG